MPLKPTVILFFIFTGIACCHSKSDRQLPFKDTPTANIPYDSVLSRLQSDSAAQHYDSALTLGWQWISDRLNNNMADTAMTLARKLYRALNERNDVQKKLMLQVYEKRNIIEKDSAALQKMYKFFGDKYPSNHFDSNYDDEYVSIAEYFISLFKKKPFLHPVYVEGFQQTLGTAYSVAGDLKKSLYYYGILYALDRKNMEGQDTASTFFCSSTINISIPLNEQNRPDSVISIVQLALSKKVIIDYYASGLCLAMADALLNKKNVAGATDYINRAEQAAIRLKNRDSLSDRLFDIYMLKSRICMKQQQFTQALAVANKALAYGLAAKPFHDRSIGKTLLQLGTCFKQLNQPDSAQLYFHQALYTVAQVDSADINSLPAEKNIYPENTMMDALDSLAMMWDEQYVQTKKLSFLKKALQARKLAFIAERKLLEAFSYDESMKSQLLFSKKRSEYALNNCWLLWQNDHAPQWIEQAILMNENSKAVALLHSLKKNKALNDLQEQDVAAVSLNRNRFQTIALEQELNTVTDQKRKEEIQNTLTKLNEEGLHLETGLKSRLPGYKRTGVDTSLLSIDSIQKRLLDDQTCLLQYFRADSGAFVVWLDDKQNQGMKWLPEKDLHMMNSFITSCRSPHGLYEKDKPAFFSLAKTCTGIALPGSIQQKIKSGQYKKLLIIPDGGFSMLPFDALTPAGDQFLVRFSTVYTGYSISTLLANDATNTKAKGMAVFAPFTKSAIGMLQRLEFSQDEAKAVDAANKQADLYTDTAARIERFRRSFETKAILHMATHATGNDSIQRIYFSDDSLDVRELYAAHTYAELVVLNGCETGVGRLDPNEGPLSLARGFYYAGARNVINSLWQIDDLASAGMFGNFYNNYSNGHTGAALRNAKLNYLNTNSGKLQAPYYWAGLVHTGIDNEKPVSKKSWWWIFPAALAIIASLILAPVIYKRRRR